MLKLIATSGILVTIGSVVTSAATIFLSIALANTFSTADYGAVVLIQSTLGTLVIFATFGTATAAVRYTAQLYDKDTDKLAVTIVSCFALILCSSSILIVLCYIFNDELSRNILNAPQVAPALQISYPAVFFLALDSLIKAVINGSREFLILAKTIIYGAIMNSSCVGFFVYIGGSLTEVGSGLLVGSLLQLFITLLLFRNIFYSRQLINVTYEFRRTFHEVLRFSFPAFLSGILVAPTHWLVQTQLARLPSGLTEVAILGIAMQVFNLILFFPTSINKAILPFLRLKSRENSDHNYSILKYSMIINGLAALSISIFVYWLAPAVLMLYGNDYSYYSDALTPFLFAAFVCSIQMPIGNTMITNGHMWLGVMMNIFWALVYIGFSTYYISNGIIAVGYGLLIAYFLHTFWIFKYARTNTRSKY